MSEVPFRYLRSEALQKQILAGAGQVAGAEATTIIDLGELDSALRQRLTEVLGLPNNWRPHNWQTGTEALGYNLAVPDMPILNYLTEIYQGPANLLVLDTELTPEHLPAILDRIAATRAAVEAKFAELRPIAEAAEAERQRRAAERKAEEREREERYRREKQACEERERQERERRDAEKRAWVAAHGSDYLKRACAAGYDCQRRYVSERVALEVQARFPESQVIIDFERTAGWNSRSCPSEGALDWALKIGGEVVWLTAAPREEPGEPDEYEEFEEREAVLLDDYLGKYRLFWLDWPTS